MLPITWGKVLDTGPPWPVRIAGDGSADIEAQFRIGTITTDDFVAVFQIAPGAFVIAKIER